jgi:hypothetical protein
MLLSRTLTPLKPRLLLHIVVCRPPTYSWRRNRAAATDLERKAVAAKRLLPSSSSSLTKSDMVDGAAYDSALVANLHVPNIRQLVNIMLDTTSSNYAIWCDLMLMTLTWYSLTDHVLSDGAFIDDHAWTRMDAVVLCWLTNTITSNLQEVIRERGRPVRHLWLALENQLLSNHETRTLHLDAMPSVTLYKVTSS